MTSYERVMAAFSFQKPDRLPRFDSFWPETVHIYRQKLNLPPNTDLADYFGNDLYVAVPEETPFKKVMLAQNGDEVIYQDGWGSIVRERHDAKFREMLEPAIKTYDDLEIDNENGKLWLPASDPQRYISFCRVVNAQKEKSKAVFAKIGGLFIRSTFMRGEVNFLTDLVADTGFATALVRRLAEHLLQIALHALSIGNLYDTGIWIYDDMAYNTTTFISPRTFAQIFQPTYAWMIEKLKKAGARYVILHSDGNILPLLDLLIDTGFDGIHPVEPKAGMWLPELRRKYWEKYGSRLILIGGMCNAHTLPNGPISAIQAQAKAIISAGREGGVVIGSHSIGPDIPPEHYLAYDLVLQSHQPDHHEISSGYHQHLQ